MHKLNQNQHQHALCTRGMLAVSMLAALSLLGCKPKVEDLRTCAERLQVTTRNGVKVVKTASGLYLKINQPYVSYQCGTTPETEKLVYGGSIYLTWNHGEFMPAVPKPFTQEQWEKLEGAVRGVLLKPWREGGADVRMYLRFDDAPPRSQQEKDKLFDYKDYWYSPSIPHKLYPLDLLPNFGIDGGPDPQAGIGPIKSKPTTYWGVRGSYSPRTKRQNTTFCSMHSPPNWDGKDHSPQATKALDPVWLVQAPTSIDHAFGNTCRGSVGADSGAEFGAMIDVPGKAVPEIDKVYKAAAQYLSNLVVE